MSCKQVKSLWGSNIFCSAPERCWRWEVLSDVHRSLCWLRQEQMEANDATVRAATPHYRSGTSAVDLRVDISPLPHTSGMPIGCVLRRVTPVCSQHCVLMVWVQK